MPKAIDHVVVAVNDLSQAIQDYERLGFIVTVGGDHAHRGSHNALITFDDGSYIELIAFKHEPPVKDNTWWDLLQIGEGLVDLALLSDDLLAELDGLMARGFAITGPVEGGRVRPDGVRIAWRVARLNTAGSERLPFLIDDITPHDLRVPRGNDAAHANGVTGIAGVTVAVSSPQVATPLYRDLLGEPSAHGKATWFMVGDQFVDLVDTKTDDPHVAAFVSNRGSGPFLVTLRGPASTSLFDTNLTHSAQFAIDPGTLG